jgi:hypothetical protein
MHAIADQLYTIADQNYREKYMHMHILYRDLPARDRRGTARASRQSSAHLAQRASKKSAKEIEKQM